MHMHGFGIRLRFVEVNQDLSNLNLAEFNAERFDVEGEIEFRFGDQVVHDWFPTHQITDEEIKAGCWQSDWMASWLDNLLEATIQLCSRAQATIPLMENPDSITFLREGQVVRARYLKASDSLEWEVAISWPDFALKIGAAARDFVSSFESNFQHLSKADFLLKLRSQIELQKEMISNAI